MPALPSALALALSLASPAAGNEGAGALPIVPDGFAVDLVAAVPEILWPSAVLALPDGSLLVAEDPMDMPGPTNEPLDRILRFAFGEDGSYEKTVFASGLNAVFGLEWIDGAVYVMNMPHLTVLRDADGDGVAEERRELLTTLGRPAPGWPGGFNDHIVTGLRLGMDGYLYVSVGDKGVPLAIGTDGSRISLRGGGVVRLDPDGGELEVVASGTRNHLDVAMTERDHVFTYDNTDDGLGWWTRFSHILPGGYYGYPWDYRDHPERFVPALAEYGGGSPCGGLVYRGDAWPAAYRGSVFFCEWGQGVVRRFEVERSGAGYRVVRHEDFMRPAGGGGSDFRPLDICESPDGRFLYVADWNYGGWTAPEKTGRVFRVRRTDGGRGAPPAAAASVEALEHPSFHERLRAQRALAREGRAAIEPLRGVLESSRSGDAARRHAIWALSLVGEKPRTPARHETAVAAPFETDPLAREAILAALRHTSADTRAEAARALGVRGRVPVGALSPLLADPDAMVRREAALAIGRSRDAGPDATAALVRALGPAESDVFLRFSIRRALETSGDTAAIAAAIPALREAARRDVLQSLRERYDLELVRALALLAAPVRGAADERVRAEVLRVLAEAHRKRPAWDGVWWQIQPAKSGWPEKTVDWAGTSIVADAVRGAIGEESGPVLEAAVAAAVEMRDAALREPLRGAFARESDATRRAAILRALAALRDDGAAPLLAEAIRDEALPDSLRTEAAEAAATIGTPAMRTILLAIAEDEALPDPAVLAALRALSRLEAAEAAPAIERRLSSPSAGIRAAAAEALPRVAGKTAAPALRAALADPEPAVRVAAVRAIGALALESEAAHLLPLVAHESTRLDAILALARTPVPLALDAYLRGVTEKNVGVRDASRRALRAIRDDVRVRIEALHEGGLLEPLALAEARALYTDPAPIARYRLLGPFPSRESVPEIPAGPIDFECRYESDDGREIAWRPAAARAEDGFVDLIAALGDRANVVAFAAAEIESPAERVAEMAVGSDDSIAVFVNGEKVHEFAGDRGFTADQDRFRATLRAGTNALLFRIGQTGGSWSFSAKISPVGDGPLFEGGAASPAADLERLRSHALASAGDPARGRALFADPRGPGCVKCHKVGAEGAAVGPELTFIGSKYSREEIVTSILEPSRTLYDEYRATILVLRDERILVGQIRETDERSGTVTLVDSGGEARVVPLADVGERHSTDRSSMPEGLAAGLTPDEFADLVAFLASLRNPETPGGGGR